MPGHQRGQEDEICGGEERSLALPIHHGSPGLPAERPRQPYRAALRIVGRKLRETHKARHRRGKRRPKRLRAVLRASAHRLPCRRLGRTWHRQPTSGYIRNTRATAGVCHRSRDKSAIGLSLATPHARQSRSVVSNESESKVAAPPSLPDKQLHNSAEG